MTMKELFGSGENVPRHKRQQLCCMHGVFLFLPDTAKNNDRQDRIRRKEAEDRRRAKAERRGKHDK
jgi:hypothetical protein